MARVAYRERVDRFIETLDHFFLTADRAMACASWLPFWRLIATARAVKALPSLLFVVKARPGLLFVVKARPDGYAAAGATPSYFSMCQAAT
jgi:hypothetical protein